MDPPDCPLLTTLTPSRDFCPPFGVQDQYHQHQNRQLLNYPPEEVGPPPQRRPSCPPPPPPSCKPICDLQPPTTYNCARTCDPQPKCGCGVRHDMMTVQVRPNQCCDSYADNFMGSTSLPGPSRGQKGSFMCQPATIYWQTCPEENCCQPGIKLVRKCCKIPQCRVKLKRKPQMCWQPCPDSCQPNSCSCPCPTRPRKCRPRRKSCRPRTVVIDPCQQQPSCPQDFYILVDGIIPQQSCMPMCIQMAPPCQPQPCQPQPQFCIVPNPCNPCQYGRPSKVQCCRPPWNSDPIPCQERALSRLDCCPQQNCETGTQRNTQSRNSRPDCTRQSNLDVDSCCERSLDRVNSFECEQKCDVNSWRAPC